MADKKKVRFIRVRGRVVPIKVKPGEKVDRFGGTKSNLKRRIKLTKAARARQQSKGKKLAAVAGAFGAGFLGLAGSLALGRKNLFNAAKNLAKSSLKAKESGDIRRAISLGKSSLQNLQTRQGLHKPLVQATGFGAVFGLSSANIALGVSRSKRREKKKLKGLRRRLGKL